jgi:maltooligosyltrehalose trehalohydrolase
MGQRLLRRRHEMPFGASLLPGGGVRFRLWAPSARRVDLALRSSVASDMIPMQPREDGWYECDAGEARAGQRYAFLIDGRIEVPDPASRFNPDDVHGPSAVIDPHSYEWRDSDWRGRPWHEAVIYELHVGTFTSAGTFAAAIDLLDDLAELGVTAVELMPVADFPGRRNWGYDGVLLFAPDTAYGTPEDLKAFIDAAHARQIMVLLDVVYNHFGPDGNYLHTYAGAFFDGRRQTPWGAAPNFDAVTGRTVRDFYIHNALFWLTEYHFDGLRLDAVHAIADDSRPDIIEELARAVHDGPGRHRHVHLVLENDRNDARYLPRGAAGKPLIATAQWNDDVHHAAHVLATGERDGYYADYADHPIWFLGRSLAEGFGFQGEPSPYRDGAPRGEPSAHLPPAAFVSFLQTHDQVGNRAFGERLQHIANQNALEALTACILLAPSPPMLFMGEEFAASSPFLYFCDFHGELAQAVTRGRRAEFGRFERFREESAQSCIPDPNDRETFERSRLDWSERTRPPHARWLDFYRGLLRLRRERLVPYLAGASVGGFHVLAPGRLAVNWPLGGDAHLHLLANLSAEPAMRDPLPPGEVLYSTHPAVDQLEPWSVRVSLEERDE